MIIPFFLKYVSPFCLLFLLCLICVCVYVYGGLTVFSIYKITKSKINVKFQTDQDLIVLRIGMGFKNVIKMGSLSSYQFITMLSYLALCFLLAFPLFYLSLLLLVFVLTHLCSTLNCIHCPSSCMLLSC